MLNPKLTLEELVMTDAEFDEHQRFELWCKKNQGNCGRKIHEFEAMEIFREDLFKMCYRKIHAKENEEHWRELLRKIEDVKNMEFNEKIRRAKSQPIEVVIARYGLTMRQNKVCCPMHGEKTPSLHIYTGDRNSWYCFGACGRGGDVIDFVQAMQKCDFKRAVSILIS